MTEHDFLRLADLTDTSITTLLFDMQKQSLLLRVEGTVGQIWTKSGPLSTDHRATFFDRIYYSVFFEYLVEAVTALAFMWIALVKFHEGLNKAVRGWFGRRR